MPSPADMLWCALVASVLLTPLAVVTGSWLILWVAALLSADVSFLGLFTLGTLTLLLTCLQLAAAIGLQRTSHGIEWKILLGGLIAWGIVVPVQILSMSVVGNALLGWYYAFPLVTVAGTIALFLAPVAGFGCRR